MKQLDVAVTGASGFIGKYVLAELVRRQQRVVAACRDKTKLAAFADAVEIVEMDIGAADRSSFERLGRPEVLIHLAWEGLPRFKDTSHYERELPRQYAFLKQLVEAGLGAMVVAGTCLEYGQQSGPLNEAMPTSPTTAYGHAKDALHRQLVLLGERAAFNLTWARLFYMYGEGQSATSLYPQLRAAAARGDAEFNMSAGEQLRDYLHVADVASILVELALRPGVTGPVNVCAGVPISVRSLVEGWLRAHGWAIRLNLGHYPYPDYEPLAFWGDRQRLDAILGREAPEA